MDGKIRYLGADYFGVYCGSQGDNLWNLLNHPVQMEGADKRKVSAVFGEQKGDNRVRT